MCANPKVARHPTVQEDEPRTVRVEKQVVEVMLLIGKIMLVGDLRDVGQIHNPLDFSRLQVTAKNTRFFGRQYIFVFVAQARIPVSGTHVRDSTEVRIDGRFSIGTDRVDRKR